MPENEPEDFRLFRFGNLYPLPFSAQIPHVLRSKISRKPKSARKRTGTESKSNRKRITVANQRSKANQKRIKPEPKPA
jgi:hypothetical protein